MMKKKDTKKPTTKMMAIMTRVKRERKAKKAINITRKVVSRRATPPRDITSSTN